MARTEIRTKLVRCGRWLLRYCAFAVLAPLLFWVTLWPPYANGPPIRSDGVGYHFWTYAFLRGDLNFAAVTGERLEAGIYPADPQRGFLHNKYAPGIAIIRFPVMALFADATSPSPVISDAEHRASLVLGALALLATAILGFACCRLVECPIWSANLAVLAITFGTGLFHYATYDGGFSHIYSALGLSILLYDGLKSLRTVNTSLPLWRTAGVVVLLVLVRNTNVVAVELLTLGYCRHLFRANLLNWRTVRQLAWSVVLPGAAGLAIQVALNSHAHGRLMLSSYAQEEFHWSQSMTASVLLAANHGLLAYYPVLTVTVIAGLIVKRTREPALLLALLLLGYAFLYGFWYCWWLGAGFGHRGFVELTPLAIPLLAKVLSISSGVGRFALIVFVCLATLVSVELMIGIWRITLPWEFATWDDYGHHVIGRHSLFPW